MLQALSTAASPSALRGSVKDDDPPDQCQPANDKSLNEIVTFPITVHESLSAQAQQLVNRSCGDFSLSLKVEPLLRKHQSKIWISVKAAAYGIAFHAIIMGLPSAELGPVTHIAAALHG